MSVKLTEMPAAISSLEICLPPYTKVSDEIVQTLRKVMVDEIWTEAGKRRKS